MFERAREERRDVELPEFAAPKRPYEAVVRKVDHRWLAVRLGLRPVPGDRTGTRGARVGSGEDGWQGACAGEDPARPVAREVVECAGEDFGNAELEGEVDGEDGVGVCIAGCIATVCIRSCCLSSVPVCERGGPVMNESRETLDS